jgi:hypothetical protein
MPAYTDAFGGSGSVLDSRASAWRCESFQQFVMPIVGRFVFVRGGAGMSCFVSLMFGEERVGVAMLCRIGLV